jgi:hypothetical protein
VFLNVAQKNCGGMLRGLLRVLKNVNNEMEISEFPISNFSKIPGRVY